VSPAQPASAYTVPVRQTAPVERSEDMGKRRILVVDDNLDVLHLVDEALTMAGYEVTTAACGAEGVSKGGMCLPDLVLLDIMMPDADGYTVYERLRATVTGAELPHHLPHGAQGHRPGWGFRRGRRLHLALCVRG
jgi:PleD family two-component response regulator